MADKIIGLSKLKLKGFKIKDVRKSTVSGGLACVMLLTMGASTAVAQASQAPQTSPNTAPPVSARTTDIDRSSLSTDFVTLKDKSKYHPRTGLKCPLLIKDMFFQSDNKYGRQR